MTSQEENCKKCGKHFSKLFSLRRHVKQMHPEKLHELAPLKYKNRNNYKFSCDMCNKNFNIERQFRFHLKSHEKVQEQLETSSTCGDFENGSSNHSKKCPLCSFSASQGKDMLQHFEEIHDVSISSNDLDFTSLRDFEIWLLDLEKDTQTKFVKNGGTKTFKNHVKTMYICHRSGFFAPEGQGLRSLKIKGSVKINGYCPASIKLVQNNNGTCHVHYIETHIGHSCDSDINYLYLTKNERQMIASQIASKVPFDDILDKIRDSTSDHKLERIHLLSRKDLHNIARCFNLTSSSIKNPTSLEDEKEAIMKQFSAHLNEIKSHAKLELVKKLLDSLSPSLASAENTKTHILPSIDKKPVANTSV